MKCITIINSYLTWSISNMNAILSSYGDIPSLLNRPMWTIYIEWWIHNIGYYLTLPFTFLNQYNLRFKDVDLEEWLFIWLN